jgi:mRNA interferase MazF
MQNKPFDLWNEAKKQIDIIRRNVFFREGEIWWIKAGINVGIEQNGKSAKFTRPYLIFKKYNNNHFLAIPLTTKKTSERFSFYLSSSVKFLHKDSWVVFSQLKAIDSKRLYVRMGKLSSNIFKNIQKKAIEHLMSTALL